MDARRPVVTISAAYGAGGSVVAPEVARALGVGLVERAIPASVAAELPEEPDQGDASVTAEEEGEEAAVSGGLSRWIAYFASPGEAWFGVPASASAWHDDEASYKEQVAAGLAGQAERGAVILGRGAALVLRDHPGALHVRLDGPVERRIAQAMRLIGLDERSARQAQRKTDAARHRYVQRLYRANEADPRLYHLVIDGTVVPTPTCVELIVTAVEAITAAPHHPDG